MQELRAACLYFVIVFVTGFALGTIRTLAIAPHLGETLSVLIELPFMLAVSWWACGYTLRRWSVATSTVSRSTMGSVALLLLLLAEATLSITLGSLTLTQHLALYATAPVLIGLAGQLLFAVFPLLRP